MKKKGILCTVLLMAALLLTGCAVRTADQMYQLPKRSEDFNNLQSAIDMAMADLEYCAPLTGENRQTVQMADLDGNGDMEYLLFAKGSAERPLRILIFDEVMDSFVHTDTIESNGSGFDLVEYVQMDEKPGVEVVVGSQLSDQVLRSVSVYTFSQSQAETLMSANYTKFLTIDLDEDNRSELFVLRPGQTVTDNGVAELYGVEDGTMERSNEVNMSGPVDHLKRIVIGKLYGGEAAVYAASTVGDTALITDVFAVQNDMLTNISFSNESGTSVQTLRNYYVYADDIDNDGAIELPYLITMKPLDSQDEADRHDLIRWYTMKADGSEVNKLYTYHNFVGGWYMELDSQWASRIAVQRQGNNYAFYLWDTEYQEAQKVMTVFALTGQNREVMSAEADRFILLKTESITYAASLEPAAQSYGITQQMVMRSFHLIQQDWKTGET